MVKCLTELDLGMKHYFVSFWSHVQKDIILIEQLLSWSISVHQTFHKLFLVELEVLFTSIQNTNNNSGDDDNDNDDNSDDDDDKWPVCFRLGGSKACSYKKTEKKTQWSTTCTWEKKEDFSYPFHSPIICSVVKR